EKREKTAPRAVGKAWDALPYPPADDKAKRNRCDQVARPCHPDRQYQYRSRLDQHQGDLGRRTVALEPAETDPGIPRQHQIQERRELDRAATADVEHAEQPEFRGLVEREHGNGRDHTCAQLAAQIATPRAFHSRKAWASRGET